MRSTAAIGGRPGEGDHGRRRWRVLAPITVVVLAFGATPAAGQTSGATVFAGALYTGTTPGPCPIPSGPGLFLPGVDDDAPPNNVGSTINQHITGRWLLYGLLSGVVRDNGVETAGIGALGVCGELAAVVLGIGAACGVSQGHSGEGDFILGGVLTPSFSLSMRAVGWAALLGNTFVLHGVWHKPGQADHGSLIGIVQTAPNASCSGLTASGISQPGGATGSQAVGVFAFS